MCYGNNSISTGHSHWTISASARARDIADMLCELTRPTEGSNRCQHQGFPAGKDDPPYIVHLCTPFFSYFFFSLIMLAQILHGGVVFDFQRNSVIDLVLDRVRSLSYCYQTRLSCTPSCLGVFCEKYETDIFESSKVADNFTLSTYKRIYVSFCSAITDLVMCCLMDSISLIPQRGVSSQSRLFSLASPASTSQRCGKSEA